MERPPLCQTRKHHECDCRAGGFAGHAAKSNGIRHCIFISKSRTHASESQRAFDNSGKLRGTFFRSSARHACRACTRYCLPSTRCAASYFEPSHEHALGGRTRTYDRTYLEKAMEIRALETELEEANREYIQALNEARMYDCSLMTDVLSSKLDTLLDRLTQERHAARELLALDA